MSSPEEGAPPTGGASEPGGLTSRPAGVDDADALAHLMFLAPNRDSVAMAGSADAGERFIAILFRRTLAGGAAYFVVAERGAELVGFAEVSHGGDDPPFVVAARAAIDAMGVAGAVRAAWRETARRKVVLEAPGGGVHLVELQVSPEQRNRGIGAFLLDRVDEYAIEQRAAHISLTTALENPARRLYERTGYRVVEQKTDARYERITGSAGRVLMVKPMAASGSR